MKFAKRAQVLCRFAPNGKGTACTSLRDLPRGAPFLELPSDGVVIQVGCQIAVYVWKDHNFMLAKQMLAFQIPKAALIAVS